MHLERKLRRVKPLIPIILADSYFEGDNINTITLPTNIISGDILVLMDHAANGTATTPSFVTPSGFTTHVNYDIKADTNQARRITFHTKIADGTEGGTTVSTMEKPQFGESLVGVFRPNSTNIRSISYEDADQAASNNAISNQTVQATSSTGKGTIVLAFGRSGSGGASPSLNGDEDGFINESGAARLAYLIINTTPQSAYTATIVDGGFGNILCSAYIEVN